MRTDRRTRRGPADRWWRTAAGALSGLLAAFAALASAELVSTAVRPEAGPVVAVGGAAIDRTPAPVKDWAIQQFGTNDKLVLQLGILAVLALAAVALGVVALRHRIVAAVGVALFGVVGALAATGRPDSTGAGDALPSLAGAVAAAGLLYGLSGRLLVTDPSADDVRRREPEGSGGAPQAARARSATEDTPQASSTYANRRREPTSSADAPGTARAPATSGDAPQTAPARATTEDTPQASSTYDNRRREPESSADAPQTAPAPATSGSAPQTAPAPAATEDTPQASSAYDNRRREPESSADAPQTAPAPAATGDAPQTAPAPATSGDAPQAAPPPAATEDAPQAAWAPAPSGDVPHAVTARSWDRRGFVIAATAAAAASAGAWVLGKSLNAASGKDAVASRGSVVLPAPGSAAPAVPKGAQLRVAGISSFVTSNEDFYRVDTALVVPKVNADTWRLRIHGTGVARARTLSYAELLGRELIERDITLTCVSNEVGGPYVGNARWIGVPLAELLDESGVVPPSRGGRADQLVARSVDGMTIGTPVEDVLDGRDAMLALGMNGEPLPFEHGFPVRMLVPGLYGYVSACKWIEDIELTTFDSYDPYWVKRDWARKAPVKTQSRIDTPKPLARPKAGTVMVAGVAWAQHRGIDKVEVRVDDGPWRVADLAAEDSRDTWRQWSYRWQATPGGHTLAVRATDRTGAVQTGERTRTIPDGASGRHSVVVTVT